MGEKSTRTIAEIERHIAQQRLQLMSDMSRLQTSVRQQLDWRRPVRRNPLPWLGGALAVGFLLGWR